MRVWNIMLYNKGDIFIATCYSDRRLDKIGMVTGRGELYQEVYKQPSFHLIFITMQGEVTTVKMSAAPPQQDYCPSVYYPILIGDQRGWMNHLGMESLEKNDAIQ